MNAATLNRLQRRYDGRAPIFRFPAVRYSTLPEDLIYDGSNRCILQFDKSGNSGVNVLALNANTSNNATFGAITAFGNGNFTLVCTFSTAAIGAAQTLIGSLDAGIGFYVNATGNLQTTLIGTGVSTQSATALSAFTKYTVYYVKSGTTATYYVNAVSDGTTPDPRNYTVGVSRVGVLGTAAANPLGGLIYSARAYSTALSGAEVAADYAGTVQANCVLNIDFSLASKLATSFTATVGGTVTINTSGATGARISGARDLYQGTGANQPILAIAAAGNYLTFDGSNDYLKAAAFSLSQPETVYFVGSQVTWVLNDYIYDGNATASGSMVQSALTPEFINNSGGALGVNAGWALNVRAVITTVFNAAASMNRVNRAAANTGTMGSTSMNGFTLGDRGAGGVTPANITAQEVLVFSRAHDEIAQQRMAREQMRQRRIAA